MTTAKAANTTAFEETTVNVRIKLAGLWTSLVLVYLYVDVLSLYKPGVVEDILAGRVWELAITQTWALGALAMMTIPSLMVFLSLAMPPRATRWTSIIVASSYIVVSIGNTIGESWGTYFGVAAAVEVLLLLMVLRYAWHWPRVDMKG